MAKKNSRKIDVKLVLKSILLIAMVLVLSFGSLYFYRKLTAKKTAVLSALIASEITKVAELAIIKNTYSDLVTIKKSAVMGMARSYVFVKYSGVIRAGIADMSQMTFSLSADRRSITLTLPPVVILSNDIVSQEIFDEVRNVFVPITTQEVFNSIRANKEQQLEKLLATGFLEDGSEHINQLVTRILYAMGFQHVEITVQ